MDFRKTLILSLLVSGVFYCSSLAAANISGAVKNASNKPAVAAKVSFKCPNIKNPFTALTDKYGRYRITGLPNTKWCSMQVNFKPYNSNIIEINSGKGSKSINIKLNKAEKSWRITL